MARVQDCWSKNFPAYWKRISKPVYRLETGETMSTQILNQIRPMLAQLTPEEKNQLLDFIKRSSLPNLPRMEVEGLWEGKMPPDADIEKTLLEIRRGFWDDLQQE